MREGHACDTRAVLERLALGVCCSDTCEVQNGESAEVAGSWTEEMRSIVTVVGDSLILPPSGRGAQLGARMAHQKGSASMDSGLQPLSTSRQDRYCTEPVAYVR